MLVRVIVPQLTPTRRPLGTLSLIVRLWVEHAGADKPAVWRGQIEHVGSGETAYFDDVASMLTMVAKLAPGFVTTRPEKGARE